MPLYSRQGPGFPWAFSVRPDLWPAGTRAAFGLGPRYLARAYHHQELAEVHLRSALDGGYGDPGAAEALILAGQVGAHPDHTGDGGSWKEVT